MTCSPYCRGSCCETSPETWAALEKNRREDEQKRLNKVLKRIKGGGY